MAGRSSRRSRAADCGQPSTLAPATWNIAITLMTPMMSVNAFTTFDSFAQYWGMQRRVTRLVAIAAVIGCLLIGYLLFIDRSATKGYQAYVALDGKGPWGLTDPPWDGPDAVVLYRSGRKGGCCPMDTTS